MVRAADACRSSCLVAVLVLCADAAMANAPAYSFDPGAGRLVLSAPGAVHCATSADGFVTLASEGSVQSSDPASAHYAPALAGLTGETVRDIEVSGAPAFSIGPFIGERLTLTSTHPVELTDALSLTDALTVHAPDVTVNGGVRVRGGDIRVLGERVTVGASARIDASGDAGGGRVLLGGDYLGGNDVPTAATTRIANGARIRADALEIGNGGRVIVWADELAAFHGHISARGGAGSGDGGFVEVSGKAKLDFTGTVDTDATHGNAGTLLLDPANITIQAMSPDINGDTSTGDDFNNAGQLDNAATDFPGANSIITDQALENVLLSGNVILAATGSITLDSIVNLNNIGANPRTLTLNAGLHVIIGGGGGVSATGAATSLDLFANTDIDGNNSGRFFQQGNIETNGGNLTIVATDLVGAVHPGTPAATRPGVYLQADITTNGGDISVTGTGRAVDADIQILSGTEISAGSGNLTLTGNRISIETATSLSGSGTLTLQPLAPATAMLVGGAGSTTTDFLTAAEIAEIGNGFGSIRIGRADSSGVLTVHATGVTFTDPLLLRSSGATNLDGVVTATDGAGVTLQNGFLTSVAAAGGIDADGAVAFSGAGLVTLLGTVTSGNASITFSGATASGGAGAALEGETVTFLDELLINGVNAGSLPVDGDVVFGPAATYRVTANGPAPSQYDRLLVTGSVTLGGTLSPSFGYTPLVGDTLLFLGNDAADSVSGAFANQAPTSPRTVGATLLAWQHTLGDGNDAGFAAIDNGADLQIAKTNDRTALLAGEQTVYAIVAANAGPTAVAAASLADVLPATLAGGSWMCVQAQSTAICPTPDAGSGNLAAPVDLGVNQYLRFDVLATVAAAANQFVNNTATITAPVGITALNVGDDSSTDSDPVVPARIHRDGFEAGAILKLTVPGAAEALLGRGSGVTDRAQ